MSNTRKLLLFVFAIALVINLQLSTTLTTGMEDGFTVKQLVDNIFLPEAFATFGGGGGDWGYALVECLHSGYKCTLVYQPSIGCFPDEDYGCNK